MRIKAISLWGRVFPIKFKFGSVGFWGERKTGEHAEKPSEQGQEPTTNRITRTDIRKIKLHFLAATGKRKNAANYVYFFSNYRINPSEKYKIIYFLATNTKLQLNPDNSNIQGKSRKVRDIGSSSYQG